MKKSNFVLLGLMAVLLSVGLILAGCSGGDDGDPPAATPTTPDTTDKTDTTDKPDTPTVSYDGTYINPIGDSRIVISGNGTAYVKASKDQDGSFVDYEKGRCVIASTAISLTPTYTRDDPDEDWTKEEEPPTVKGTVNENRITLSGKTFTKN